MPVQTAIQVRRGTASSWTSTNPTLAAGEIGFETDTSKFKIGTGSTAWNSLNYFVQDPVTTKGDLYTFSTTDARLAVGNNGETLVADSSASQGLRWQGNFAAGKNKVINGAFDIWQRGTSFSTPTYPVYYADRWLGGTDGTGVTRVVSQQTFTPGTAPVAGYEGQYFLRINQSVAGTGANYNVFDTKLEDVRTFAGQTVTISFWAKAAAATTLGNIDVTQSFGSGGSSDVGTAAAIGTISTSWARYSYTMTLPSLAGKTIGTGSFVYIRFNLPKNATFTLDIWGVQLEAGNTATAFQTATGTLAGELGACQRYYYVLGSAADRILGAGFNQSASRMHLPVIFPVTMRTAPTLSATSGTNYYNLQTTIDDNFNSLTIGNAQIQSCYLFNNTEIAGTAGQAGMVITSNAAASVAFSAEL